MKKEKNLVPQSLSALVPSREKATFTLAEGATHVAPSKACRRGAFTLAEVLITLAVVGVVAALTMPGLINHFKVQYLKSRFQKVDSVIQQAIKNSVREMGYDSIADFNRSPGDLAYTRSFVPELNEHFLKQFKIIKKVKESELYHKKAFANDMFGEKLPSAQGYYFSGGVKEGYILEDGTYITPFYADHGGGINPSVVVFIFDTNGPFKGPNRKGHDIFRYSTTVLIPNYQYLYCNPTIKNSEKLEGCYKHATRNVHPVTGESGSYWDILYKPMSYWENLQNSQ